MEKERSYEGGFSVIEVTATLAVLLLVGSAVWQSHAKINDQKTSLTYEGRSNSHTENTAVVPDPYDQALADVMASGEQGGGFGTKVIEQLLNSYATAKNDGTYTSEYAAALGSSIAPMIKVDLAYGVYTEKNIVTSPDTSEKASLVYQVALHDALAPLRTNTTPEFEFFGMYLQTKDPRYLTDLLHVASLYKSAASNASLIVVPIDVVKYHLAIMNALEEFSAILNALATHANDPIESTVLLRNYNSGERSVLAAFNALQTYYAKKYVR